MRYHEIIQLDELRKNPEQNPKIPINQQIVNAVEKIGHGDSSKVFVSFTEIDKLGINPKSKYNTPIGIYAYSAAYIIDKIGEYKSMSNLPFAGNQKYANIFTTTGNVINLNDITEGNLSSYYELLVNAFVKLLNIKPGTAEWKKEVDLVEKRVILYASQNAKFNTPPGKFWYVSMQLAGFIETKNSIPINWNKLFRTAGIHGIIDNGNGIIHTSEPHQSVIFATTYIQDTIRVYNSYSPGAVKKSETHGEFLKSFKQQPEDVQVSMITKNPDLLEYLPQASDKVKMAAISADPAAFENIKNPSPAVELHLVKQAGWLIQTIKNPDEATQMAAIADDLSVISHIKNPTEKVQLAAVTQDPGIIVAIKNPTEKVQLAAVTKDPETILRMHNASEKAQLEAIRINPRLITSYFHEPRTPFTPAVTTLAKKELAKQGIQLDQYFNVIKN